MAEKINPKNFKPESHKNFKKSNLDILTEENDYLLKNLKIPGRSNRAS